MIGMQRQRGSLMIVTIVMILVLGFLGVAISFLSVSSTHNAVDELAASEAFVLAESGLERGIKQWSLAPAIYVGEGPVSFGNGSFTVAAPVVISASQATISSSASVPTINGSVSRTVEATVDLGGVVFSTPVDSLADWPTEVLINNQGTNKIAEGGLRAKTDNSKGAIYNGYRETGTAPPVINLSAGQSINLDLEYNKRFNGGGGTPLKMDMAVELVDTTGTSHVVWSENNIIASTGWVVAPTTSWTVPAGVTINRIRLSFNLQRNGKGKNIRVIFRNIAISSAAGGGGGGGILSWQEMIP